MVVVDDYNDYSGCRQAVDEFLERHPEIGLLTPRPHAILSRIC
jgi:hypothetical protein